MLPLHVGRLIRARAGGRTTYTLDPFIYDTSAVQERLLYGSGSACARKERNRELARLTGQFCQQIRGEKTAGAGEKKA